MGKFILEPKSSVSENFSENTVNESGTSAEYCWGESGAILVHMNKTLGMTAGMELRKLKSEITTFDCPNYQDLTFTTHRINRHIRMIFETHPVKDAFLMNYIEEVVLKHITIIENYIEHIEQEESKLPFVTKALRYHFNCIIDSFTYALLTHQH